VRFTSITASLMRDSLVAPLNGVLAVALAPACAACGRILDAPLAGAVCDACWAGVQPLPHADTAAAPPIDGWQAAGAYKGALRDIVHALKYDRRRSLARPLGLLLRERAAHLLADADVVVPVPLHAWRRLRRGFNQADDLARRLGPPVCRALWRTRATPPQTGLGAAERRANVRGAFRVSPFVRRGRLRGARIVLVDDVRTTGATLRACARVLKAAGAREVRAVTVARAAMA
jgi:ComF family protein